MSEGWRPPEPEQFQPGNEQLPWARWLAGGLLVAAIVAGAIWLAMLVIVPDEVPGGDGSKVAEVEEVIEEEKPKLSSDDEAWVKALEQDTCLLYTSPSPRDATLSRMPSSA